MAGAAGLGWPKAVAAYEAAFDALRVNEPWADANGATNLPYRSITASAAAMHLATLRDMPADVATVSDGRSSSRWEVVQARGAKGQRYESHDTGILLVRDKSDDTWRSILDCHYAEARELHKNTLLLSVHMECDRNADAYGVRVDLETLRAHAFPERECETLADCGTPE